MDLYCTHCREPWDNDVIHDEVEERNAYYGHLEHYKPVDYKHVLNEFYTYGCGAFHTFSGERCEFTGKGQPRPVKCARGDGKSDPVISAIYDLMGDDSDGAASFLADMGMS